MATVTKDDIREILGVESPAESIKWINALIYGDPGAGKTYLGGTAQDHEMTKPLLVLDVEGGTMTLRNKPDVDVIQVRKMEQVEDAINKIYKQPEMYYQTILVDSGSELQKLDMRTVMREQHAKKPETTDIYVPSQREWGKSGERVRMIVRALRDLECNVIVTALAAETTDERTGRKLIHPNFPGKLKVELAGFFDIVGYLKASAEGGEVKRTLQTLGTTNLIAKDRTGVLDHLVENPSVPMLWDTIHSSNGKSNSNSKKS